MYPSSRSPTSFFPLFRSPNSLLGAPLRPTNIGVCPHSQVTLAVVSEGLNQLYVETTDGTGNVLVTAFDWIVDLTTPTTGLENAGGEAINRTFFRTATIEMSANDVIPVQVRTTII